MLVNGKLGRYRESIRRIFSPPSLWIIDLLRPLDPSRRGRMFSERPFRFRDGRFRGSGFGKALGLVRAPHKHGEPAMVGDGKM